MFWLNPVGFFARFSSVRRPATENSCRRPLRGSNASMARCSASADTLTRSAAAQVASRLYTMYAPLNGASSAASPRGPCAANDRPSAPKRTSRAAQSSAGRANPQVGQR